MKKSKKETKEKDTEDKKKSVIDQINTKFGKGTIIILGENFEIEDIPVVSTGSFGLDLALGVNGIPRGRITEIYGKPSSGKTTISLHTIAEAQKAGLKAAFIDVENALDIKYAKALGVDIGKLAVSQPNCGEDAFDIIDSLVESGEFGIVVVDSVAALTPRAELEGDYGDANMGLHARLMSQAMRKLSKKISRTSTAVVFLNQIRHKIVMFGNPETTTGGNALKFYASVRMDVKQKTKPVISDEVAIATDVEVNIVKNKVAPPFRQATFQIKFGKGIDVAGEVFDMAVKHGIIEQDGSWFSYGTERIGHGKEAATKNAIKNGLLGDIKKSVIEKIRQDEKTEEGQE